MGASDSLRQKKIKFFSELKKLEQELSEKEKIFDERYISGKGDYLSEEAEKMSHDIWRLRSKIADLKEKKEKTADELFEELGYEKYDNHPEQDFPPEPNMFTTQDVRRLYYEQTGVLENGMKGLEHIEFDLIKRNVVCWARINGRFTIVPLSIKELQAINKKCEELGWI